MWEQFAPDVGEWLRITWEPGVGELPLDKQFNIRRGRVGADHGWFEIHPNDQGRVNMVAVGHATELQVRLFSQRAATPHSNKRDEWSWEFDDDRRIAAGVITHFKVA